VELRGIRVKIVFTQIT